MYVLRLCYNGSVASHKQRPEKPIKSHNMRQQILLLNILTHNKHALIIQAFGQSIFFHNGSTHPRFAACGTACGCFENLLDEDAASGR